MYPPRGQSNIALSAQPQESELGVGRLLCEGGSLAAWWAAPAAGVGTRLTTAPADPHSLPKHRICFLMLQSSPVLLQSLSEFRHQMLPVWTNEGLPHLASLAPQHKKCPSVPKDNSSLPVLCLSWCKWWWESLWAYPWSVRKTPSSACTFLHTPPAATAVVLGILEGTSLHSSFSTYLRVCCQWICLNLCGACQHLHHPLWQQIPDVHCWLCTQIFSFICFKLISV